MYNWPWWITVPVNLFYAMPDWVWIVAVIIAAAIAGKWFL